MAQPSLIETARVAMSLHASDAERAYVAFVDHCGGIAPPRVPGMDTHTRLAIRIHGGRTIEEAAAREYLYRWSLAIKAPDQCVGDFRVRNPVCSVFGTPHPIGM